jgi:hypothetical protein
MRGPAVTPGPLTPTGGPRRPTRRDRFDSQVLEVVEALEERWADELGLMELAVEEAPVLPEGWDESTVPLASVVRRRAAAAGGSSERVRLVVFRRPIELRAATPEDLSALILTVVVEQVAELLGRPPHEVDPRYDDLGE